MNIRVVYAALVFKTPCGMLQKHVNWSYYEASAVLSTSSTSYDAFDKFLEYGERIISSSIIELKYLTSIRFYEDNGIRRNPITSKKTCKTDTIKIIRDNEGRMMFEVEPL